MLDLDYLNNELRGKLLLDIKMGAGGEIAFVFATKTLTFRSLNNKGALFEADDPEQGFVASCALIYEVSTEITQDNGVSKIAYVFRTSHGTFRVSWFDRAGDDTDDRVQLFLEPILPKELPIKAGHYYAIKHVGKYYFVTSVVGTTFKAREIHVEGDLINVNLRFIGDVNLFAQNGALEEISGGEFRYKTDKALDRIKEQLVLEAGTEN